MGHLFTTFLIRAPDMKNNILLAIATCLITLNSTALHAMDLAEIYKLALNNDAELMIAKSELESLKQNLPLASSTKLPQIYFAASATKNDENSSLPALDEQQDILTYSITLQQSIYNGEIWAQVDATEASIITAETNFMATQQNLIVRVTEAYFNILSAQDTVEFVEAEKNAIGRQLEQAKKRFEVGLIAITDVKEAQASYDLSLSSEIIADNALDNEREALQLIIGQPLSEPIAPLGEDINLLIPKPNEEKNWVDQALKYNLTLLSAQSNLKTANENRNLARAGHSPTLDLIASYADTSIKSNTDYDTEDLSVSIQLSVPLYTGGQISAAVKQAELNYSTAKNNLLLQKRLTIQQTNNAHLAVESGIGQVNALQQALVSTNAAMEATEAGFDVGTRTSVDVLISLRETYRSKRDYASSRYAFLVNTLKLKQAAGLLNEDDLIAINSWLIQ